MRVSWLWIHTIYKQSDIPTEDRWRRLALLISFSGCNPGMIERSFVGWGKPTSMPKLKGAQTEARNWEIEQVIKLKGFRLQISEEPQGLPLNTLSCDRAILVKNTSLAGKKIRYRVVFSPWGHRFQIVSRTDLQTTGENVLAERQKFSGLTTDPCCPIEKYNVSHVCNIKPFGSYIH